MKEKNEQAVENSKRIIKYNSKQTSSASKLQVRVKLTEVSEVRSFLGAVEMAKDKVEEGDISKGTAYSRIIRAYELLIDRIMLGPTDESESI